MPLSPLDFPGKNVMTQARKKRSLSRCHGEGRDCIDGWSHGKTMGRAWPERCLKEGVSKRGKQKKPVHMERWMQDGFTSQARLANFLNKEKTKKDVAKKGKSKVSKKLREEKNRKLYPLRGRSSTPEGEALSCHVLLTRLEGDPVEQGNELRDEDPNIIRGRNAHRKTIKTNKKLEKAKESSRIPSKTKSEPTINKILAQEPRKRRLASLNAEAVNSLLLEKTDAPPGSKLAKKQQHEAPPVAVATDAKICSLSKKTESCQSHKKAKKSKSVEKDDTELSLYTPTPRRLAGLNAAALLKLTSSSTGSKQRVKTDSKDVRVAGKQTVRSKTRVRQPKKQGFKQTSPQGGCAVCKRRECFEAKPKWERATSHHHLTKPGYQSRSMMGYPLKVVKEEQVETDISPSYFCCPPEGSVEYCHRLALFLGQKAYSETEEHPVTSVKHECLVTPSTLAHPALTLSAHPCLCADPCYSSYYVHIAHPGPPSASLSTQPLPCAHRSLCPRRVPRSKLLSSSVSHASGIPHPAFCNSVGSPCFSEGCRVGSYAFSAIQPVTSRACTFATGCSNCSPQIKTGERWNKSEVP